MGRRLGLGEVDGWPTVRSSDHHWPDIRMVMMMTMMVVMMMMTKFREFYLNIDLIKRAILVGKMPEKSGQGLTPPFLSGNTEKDFRLVFFMDMVFVVVVMGKMYSDFKEQTNKQTKIWILLFIWSLVEIFENPFRL